MFTDPTVQRLWDAGRILAAYEASAEPIAEASAHPFRDQHLLRADAQHWHERGVLCWSNARDAEASAALGRAYELRRNLLGPDHEDTLETVERQAALARSVPKFEAVIERLIAVFDDQHLRVAIARRNLAAQLRNEARFTEARAVLQLAAPVIESSLPAAHTDVVALLKVDALLCAYEKSFDTAIARAARAIEVGRGLWTEGHPFIAAAELTIVGVELALEQYKRARQRLPSICARFEAAYGEHPILGIALWLGARIDRAGGFGLLEADRDLRRAIGIFKGRGREAAQVEVLLFEIMFQSGRTIEAEEYANAIFEAASQDARYMIAGRLERAFRRAGWSRSARRWAESARDASPDEETRARWAEYLAPAAKRNRDT